MRPPAVLERLFVTPDERPCVTFEAGRTRPLVHRCLPAALSSLGDC